MKKIFKRINGGLKDLLKIVIFCFKLTYQTSKFYFTLRFLLNLILTVLPFANIYLYSNILNYISQGSVSTNKEETIQQLIIYSIILLIVIVLHKAGGDLKEYFESMHGDIMSTETKYIIMKKAAELDLSFYDSSEFYNELSDTGRSSPLIIQTTFFVMDIIKYLIQFIIAFINLSHYNLTMSTLLVVSIIPQMFFQNKQVSAAYRVHRDSILNERKMHYSSNLLFSREFAKDFRMYNLFSLVSSKFYYAWNEIFNLKKKTTKKYTWLLIFTSVIPEIIITFFVIKMGSNIIRGYATIGDFSYHYGMINQVLVGGSTVIQLYSRLMDGKIRINNYIKVMNFKSLVVDTGKRKLPKTFSIEFRDVSFQYAPNLHYVLKNINFKVMSNEKTALVGENGSGKTSIIKLLLRFYDVTEGSVLLDDVNIKEYSLKNLRNHFGTMFQDYANYAFSVRESITLSDYPADNDTQRLMDSLKKGGAYEFVSKLPHGINTYLTRQFEDSGVALSGGQWQKIALARTFFQNAETYILDEPSASMDAESEDELFSKFNNLHKYKGAILVSHRLSNITSFDNILVLENGTIIEIGNHAELIHQNGRYAYMFKLQADKYR